MTFDLYDYQNDNAVNEFKEWSKNLQKPLLAKLNNRLDQLLMNGDSLFPEMLSGTKVPGILKLKIKGKVQLRPMLCKGPVNVGKEYTLLFGAFEKGDVLVPKDAENIALNKKNMVIEKPATRRRKHERVS